MVSLKGVGGAFVMSAVAVGMTAAVACGDTLELPPTQSPPNEAGAVNDDAGGGTLVPSATRCAWDAPFDSDPVKLDVLHSPEPGATEFGLTFTAQEQKGYFVRKIGPTESIHRTARFADGTFAPPSNVTIQGFDPPDDSAIWISISPDGEQLYLSYYDNKSFGKFDYDIFISNRIDDDTFTTPVRLGADVNKYMYSDTHPNVEGDLLLFTSSFTYDGGPVDNALYSIPRAGGPRTKLPGSDTDGGIDGWGIDDGKPTMSRDRLTLYFASRRTNGADIDIYVSHRTSAEGRFSDPVPLAGISSPDLELPLHLSDDNCRFYFARDNASKGASLYVASRKPTLP